MKIYGLAFTGSIMDHGNGNDGACVSCPSWRRWF